jgi:hypothetical protein
LVPDLPDEAWTFAARSPLSTPATSKPSSPKPSDCPCTATPAADTAKALTYFKTNAHRMQYGYFREPGMFIGSSTVEAGCKAVIDQRVKLSGMRWNIPGATGILTLRREQASNRFKRIWTHLHNQTATA